MKKITLLMALAAMLTNGWAQDLITPHQDNSVSGTENDHAWVDLGLPSGLKWATCNVGATNPWDYGNYFAWGETAPKSTYNWSTYLDGRITKSEDFGTDKDLLNGITDISGTQYDAARTNMGGDWRMPTTEEQNELVENCYWEWTDSYNGKSVSGYIVYRAKDDSDKGKKKTKEGENSTTTTLASYSLADAHIFFPAAGAVYVGEDYDGLHGVGNWGDYWSSSFYVDDPGMAYYKNISGADVLIRGRGRVNGRSVRGVYDPIEYSYVDLGLPSGLKWATSNVGAANPWDYGNYFAWGETAPKSTYNWSTYLDGRITKSEDCGTDKDLLNGITDISGTQYDAARTNMGGDWRMPTTEEQNELVENCYWEWTDSYNGKSVSGYIVYRAKDDSDKGKKKTKEGENSTTTTLASYSLADAHIFFPAAGAVYVGEDYDGLHGVGNWGDYWSSSFYVDDPGKAYYKTISMADVLIRGRGRGNGRSVRGVYDSSETTAIEDTKENESINIVKYIDARGNVHIVLPDGRVYNIVGASVK